MASRGRRKRRARVTRSASSSAPAAAPSAGEAPAASRVPLRWWEGVPLLATGALLAACMHSYRGYIKDDAFISFRFARNLADGHGMVFNIGERVEGYTNFLWVVLHAPVFWVGGDPVVWSKVLGVLCSLGAMVLVFLGARWLHGRPSPMHYIGPLVLASSTSVALWSMSGMAPTLMMVAGLASVLALWRALETGRRGDFALAGGAMIVAALTRPEGHMFFIAGALAVAIQALRRRRFPREAWWMLGLFAAVIGPYHLWRYLYFGYLLPNTYYAKATAGSEVWASGLEQLLEFYGFNLNAVLAVAMLAALVPRRHRALRGIAVGLCLFFMLYLIKVGRDEMKHFRLFLPVYGLFVLMAGEGMRALVELYRGWRPPWMAAVPAFAPALVVVAFSLQLTHERRYENGYLEMSRASFQQMGAYIADHSDPDDTAIFQDMGACPYAAYPLRFVDPIGVVNPVVAHELAAIGLNPFLRGIKAQQPGGTAQIREFDARIRDHLFEQEARWFAFVAYVSKKPRGHRKEVARRFDEAMAAGDLDAVERLFAGRLRGNSHSHGAYGDPRFARRYRIEAVWQRNKGYYLVLFQARDAAPSR